MFTRQQGRKDECLQDNREGQMSVYKKTGSEGECLQDNREGQTSVYKTTGRDRQVFTRQ